MLKNVWKGNRENLSFLVVPRHGGEMAPTDSKNFLDSVFFQYWKKTESKKFCLFSSHFSLLSGTPFFFIPLKIISSLYTLPDIFQHQGSGNSLRGLKAACIGPALSKFLPKCWGWSNLTHPPPPYPQNVANLLFFLT